MTTYDRLETKIVAIQLELTNACPLAKCAECAYRYMERPVGNMPLDFAKMVIDGAVEAFGTGINFNLNGLGEGLSYPHLAEVIRYIGQKAPQGRIELFTSLIGPPERITDVCRALLEVNNNVLLATTCHIRDDEGNILKKTANHFQFPTVYNLLGNISRIDLHVATNVSIHTTEEDIKTFNDVFLPILGKDKVHVIERLDSWLGKINIYAREVSDVGSPSVCDYNFRVLFIEWDGTVKQCCTDTIDDKYVIGKITQKKDVKNIWFSSIMEELRIQHNNLNCENLNPCNSCGRTKGYIKR